MGRQLDSIMSPDGALWTFEYDHNGLRTEREYSYYGDVILNTKYTWVDEKLVREYRSGGMNATPITIEYFYDGEELIGFTYNGENYYYGKTNNGEIRFIYDENGNIVTTYLYDAWGVPISITGSLASTVGQINPFRYKSYYYDSETRLYYLRSRSYDPAVGRFLNADAVEFLGVTQTVLGFNLFTYCENNAVNNLDSYGNFIIEASTALLLYKLLTTVVISLIFMAIIMPKIQKLWNSLVNDLCNANRVITKELKSLSVTIYDSLIKSRSYKKNEGTNKHHIVPRNAFLCKHAISLMEKVGIGRDSSYNLVNVRKSLHVYLHTHAYQIGVSTIIEVAYAKGKKDSERHNNIINALNAIRAMILVANGPTV